MLGLNFGIGRYNMSSSGSLLLEARLANRFPAATAVALVMSPVEPADELRIESVRHALTAPTIVIGTRFRVLSSMDDRLLDALAPFSWLCRVSLICFPS